MTISRYSNLPPPKKIKVGDHKCDFKPPLAPDSPESSVQEWMNKWIDQVQGSPSFQSIPVDGHAMVTYSNRKPDVVCYAKGTPRSGSNIVFIGDVKKRREGRQDFTDEEKGHIMDFLQELVQTQPFRESVRGTAVADGFLCDSRIIQFFRLTRQKQQGNYEWTGEESLVFEVQKEGGAILLAMLESAFDQRGWNVPKVIFKEGRTSHEVGVLELLGSGATGNVFRGMLDEKPIVIKVFHANCESAFTTELRALQELAKYIKHLPANCHVTTLLGEGKLLEDGRKVLLLEPEGRPFACSGADQQRAAGKFAREGPCLASSTHFRLLVDVLRFLHTYPKLGHRDVKLSNFFALDDSILLNDFGSSAQLGSHVLFSGALQNAPQLCVEAWHRSSRYQVQASHDLEMVARAIFQRVSPQLYALIQGCQDPVELRDFWQTHATGQVWQRMLQAAQTCNYDALKELIVSDWALAGSHT